MTYSPGGPGYPPAQASGSYGAATSSFAKPEDSESKLPQYLTAATAVLGLLAYVVSFGASAGGGLALTAAVLAALLAAVSLLPKSRNYTAIVAVVAVLGALMAISRLLNSTGGFSTGWAPLVLLGLTVVQAIVAVGALLLDAGVLTAPVPRPKYDQYSQYGLPPGGYYGQSGPHQQHGSHQQQHPQHSGPNPGYQSQYGGYPSASSTGGFDAVGQQQNQQLSQQQSQQQGASTPPTGFPSFSPPPGASGSGQGLQGPGGGDQGQSGYGYGDSGHGQQQTPSPSGPTQS